MLYVEIYLAYVTLGFQDVAVETSHPLANRAGWARKPTILNCIIISLIWPYLTGVRVFYTAARGSWSRCIVISFFEILARLITSTSFVIGSVSMLNYFGLWPVVSILITSCLTFTAIFNLYAAFFITILVPIQIVLSSSVIWLIDRILP